MTNQDPSFKSYYSLLTVPENADKEEIRAAYLKLVLKYHPDKNGAKYKEHFLQIQNAYEVLSNPLFKKAYDEQIKQNFEQSYVMFEQASERLEKIDSNRRVKKSQFSDFFIVHLVYWFFVLMSFFYLILAKEVPLIKKYFISEWTIGLISMLILNGIALGIWSRLQNKQSPSYLSIKSLLFFVLPWWVGLLLNYSKIDRQTIVFFVINLMALAFGIGIKNHLALIQTVLLGGNILILSMITGYKVTSFYVK